MGIKGSWKRPRSITREEAALRDALFYGEITRATFNRRFAKLRRAGLIRRGGRIIE